MARESQMNLWHNGVMSLLELQQQIDYLSPEEQAALMLYLQKSLSHKVDKLTAPRLSLAGLGHSGIGDLSERVDELLFAERTK